MKVTAPEQNSVAHWPDEKGGQMTFVAVGVVLLGDSFPVQAIKTSDFTFRHRALFEKLRLPMALQAENDVVSMQVFPERFEATITKPDRLDIQAEGLREMVDTFLEYVGKRTVSAVGLNMGWAVPGTADRKYALARQFLRTDIFSEVLGSEPIDPNISFAFGFPGVEEARAQVNSSAPGDVGITFNFHYEMSGMAVTDAVSRMPEAIGRARGIAQAIEDLLAKVNTQ